jgi:hypothetical protein
MDIRIESVHTQFLELLRNLDAIKRDIVDQPSEEKFASLAENNKQATNSIECLSVYIEQIRSEVDVLLNTKRMDSFFQNETK